MSNDGSSFLWIKQLSLSILIELGDNNSVTATHYRFVDIIQGYDVEALQTRTFWLSLLSINQLDLGGHTTIFWNRKYSITSPSSCNLAGKLINGTYIIVPATTLLSSTTKKEKETYRKWESSLSRALITEPIITEPMIASMNPPASSAPSAPLTAKPMSTPKSPTISESGTWHRPLAHINPTTMKSVIDRYTHDDSMCRVCMHVNNKQTFIIVPFKRTTKPFKLAHSDVCKLFSTPTFGDNW